MEFSWMPYVDGLWMFALVCLLFMAVMMIACRGIASRCGHCARSGDEIDAPNRGPAKPGREIR